MKSKQGYIAIIIGFLFMGIHSDATAQQKVDSLLNVARFQFFDNPDRSLRIADSLMDSGDLDANNLVKTLLVKATAYMSKRQYQAALTAALETEAYLSEVEPYQRTNSLNKIGEIYYNLKLYDKALLYLDQSIGDNKNSETDSRSVALNGFNYAIRGFIYREQMSCDIAISYFDQSLAEYKKSDENLMKANISTILYHKGNCLRDLDRYDEAKEVYLESIRYAEAIQAKTLVSFPELGLAEVLIRTGEHEKAQEILLETLQLSEDVGDLELNKDLYRALADTYLAVNDWENYKKYHRSYMHTLNEIKMDERNTINASLIQLRKDQKLQSKELERQFFWKKLFLLTGIFITIVLGIIFLMKLKKQLRELKENLPLFD